MMIQFVAKHQIELVPLVKVSKHKACQSLFLLLFQECPSFSQPHRGAFCPLERRPDPRQPLQRGLPSPDGSRTSPTACPTSNHYSSAQACCHSRSPLCTELSWYYYCCYYSIYLNWCCRFSYVFILTNHQM